MTESRVLPSYFTIVLCAKEFSRLKKTLKSTRKIARFSSAADATIDTQTDKL